MIRQAILADAPEIARLLTMLGHPTTAEAVASRWDEWLSGDSWALVACLDDGTLTGVATLHRMLVLHRPLPVGRITALVVDPSVRGTGLGRKLVAAAEDFLTVEGCGLLEITSNTRLANAHEFYEHLEYERTSIRFAKRLTRELSDRPAAEPIAATGVTLDETGQSENFRSAPRG
ncbi:MAG TPA: GNAT family N-acetyltransferase [Longimicrobium sp.]|jgi:GNAT superfamily N-acetyltransferase